MKMRATSKKGGSGARFQASPAGTAAEHAHAAQAARAAIRSDPALPENYAALAGALRMLSQSAREQGAQGADHLLHLACAAAWEAKRRTGPGLISGRTKHEVKILIAWLRTRNHLGPEASESLMDRIHSEYLGRALDNTDLLHNAGVDDQPTVGS